MKQTIKNCDLQTGDLVLYGHIMMVYMGPEKTSYDSYDRDASKWPRYQHQFIAVNNRLLGSTFRMNDNDIIKILSRVKDSCCETVI